VSSFQPGVTEHATWPTEHGTWPVGVNAANSGRRGAIGEILYVSLRAVCSGNGARGIPADACCHPVGAVVDAVPELGVLAGGPSREGGQQRSVKSRRSRPPGRWPRGAAGPVIMAGANRCSPPVTNAVVRSGTASADSTLASPPQALLVTAGASADALADQRPGTGRSPTSRSPSPPAGPCRLQCLLAAQLRQPVVAAAAGLDAAHDEAGHIRLALPCRMTLNLFARRSKWLSRLMTRPRLRGGLRGRYRLPRRRGHALGPPARRSRP
jgi:hypothetical protein